MTTGMADADDGLLARAVAGVLRGAQAGELPLFAWTLGLDQGALLELIAQCFPEIGALSGMPEARYRRFLALAPTEFAPLAALLQQHRNKAGDARRATWLAHAVAAACFGDRHLWQDLGLADRAAVSRLLASHFQPLHDRNTAGLRWKHFLFEELGPSGMRPPSCARCEQSSLCFAPGIQGKESIQP